MGDELSISFLHRTTARQSSLSAARGRAAHFRSPLPPLRLASREVQLRNNAHTVPEAVCPARTCALIFQRQNTANTEFHL